MEYKVTEKDIKGDIKDFPIEVVQRMVDCQVEQDNKACIDVLQYEKTGGFEWRKTKEGLDFWHKVISEGNFDLFFEKYPKTKQIDIMESNKIIINGITLPKGTEAKVSVEDGATIITFKKQESEEPKFKDGDIIYSERYSGYSYIAIYKGPSSNESFISYHVMLSGNDCIIFDGVCTADDFRLATKREQEKLFNELANQEQLKWNAEKLEFEEYRWRAVNEQKYYYVNEYGVRCSDGDYGFELDNKRYALHNYFQTKELANKAWTLYRDFFKNLKID